MSELINFGREVIHMEAEAVSALADRINEDFERAVEAILTCRGRVIVSGMGKSGLIGKKITATLNSTGISSFFLHPAEAGHGDLGLMRSDDIMLVISKSGRLGEIELVMATGRRLGVTIIALVGDTESELAKRADILLDCSVDKEACPNNLVPTSSTTVTLVMGDALAVALLKARNFSAEDFAQFHPGGTLGWRLLKKVNEIHHTGDAIPIVKETTSMQEMLVVMTEKRLGCVILTDSEQRMKGIFTDGDLRRLLDNKIDLYALSAGDVMKANPKTISAKALLEAALSLMEKHAITQLASTDDDGRVVGIIHLHDILKSKLV